MSEFGNKILSSEAPERPDTFNVRMNEEERAEFNEAKRKIRQVKDSTAIKQLAKIGMYVLQSREIGHIVETLFNNDRRNKRIGVSESEFDRGRL